MDIQLQMPTSHADQLASLGAGAGFLSRRHARLACRGSVASAKKKQVRSASSPTEGVMTPMTGDKMLLVIASLGARVANIVENIRKRR